MKRLTADAVSLHAPRCTYESLNSLRMEPLRLHGYRLTESLLPYAFVLSAAFPLKVVPHPLLGRSHAGPVSSPLVS